MDVQKVAREEVLQHLVRTYLTQRDYFKDDCWYAADVQVCELVNIHPEFRRFKTPPGVLYVDVFRSYIKPLLEVMEFMPRERLAESRVCCIERDGQLCVIDGSLRVFNAIEFDTKTLPAYVWRQGGSSGSSH